MLTFLVLGKFPWVDPLSIGDRAKRGPSLLFGAHITNKCSGFRLFNVGRYGTTSLVFFQQLVYVAGSSKSCKETEGDDKEVGRDRVQVRSGVRVSQLCDTDHVTLVTRALISAIS